MIPVVLIPGVGLRGWAFDSVVARLDMVPHRVVERPTEIAEVTAQADEIAASIAHTEGAAFVVGVSGGATVGLALAARHPQVVRGALLHEPLIGERVPALHALIAQRAALAAGATPDELCAIFAGLIGHATWASLSDEQRSTVDLERVRTELPRFARFALNDSDVVALRAQHLRTTVGGRSGRERVAVAEWLATHAGCAVSVIEAAGNSAHLDAPEALARQVLDSVSS
ncbi:MAG: alpha/beta hydrolase [Acidimicrobiales bacterium]|nr:alpha/beta hydrolase [Acidimicrobiales bacterium]